MEKNEWNEAGLLDHLELVKSGVEPFEGTKKYVATGSLQNGEIIDPVEVTYKNRPSRANMEAKENDILFAKMKDTKKVFLVSNQSKNHIYSTGFSILRIRDEAKLLPKYVYYWIRSKYFQKLKNKFCTGATQKAINNTNLKKIKISYPNIKLQQQIVDNFDKIESINNQKEEECYQTKKYLNSIFFELFGDPITNPKKWALKPLSFFGEWKSGGTPSRKKREFFQGKIPWYTAGELNNLFIDNSNERITDQAINQSAAKIIQPNSLLLGMYDTAALKSSITTKKSSCNQAIAYSSLENNNVNIFYLYFAIQIGKEYLRRRQRGVRQKNLNLTMIRKLRIPTPPIELQNKFGSIVKNLIVLEEKQNQSISKLSQLSESFSKKIWS